MARSDPSPALPEELWNFFFGACDEHVERECTAPETVRKPVPPSHVQPTAPIQACTYPARPVNGGSLERALPKTGQWCYEPKYNGWRALVHAPTGTMFNRHGTRLSIAKEFSRALALLQKIHLVSPAGLVEWFDCEALERRHGLGRGTLMVFDYIQAGNKQPYLERASRLAGVLRVHPYAELPQPERIYAVVSVPGTLNASECYRELRQVNRQWRCTFYEGLVAKRADSLYPVQLRSATVEFAGWVKHRWAR
jgi:hypothetical protein